MNPEEAEEVSIKKVMFCRLSKSKGDLRKELMDIESNGRSRGHYWKQWRPTLLN